MMQQINKPAAASSIAGLLLLLGLTGCTYQLQSPPPVQPVEDTISSSDLASHPEILRIAVLRTQLLEHLQKVSRGLADEDGRLLVLDLNIALTLLRQTYLAQRERILAGMMVSPLISANSADEPVLLRRAKEAREQPEEGRKNLAKKMRRRINNRAKKQQLLSRLEEAKQEKKVIREKEKLTRLRFAQASLEGEEAFGVEDMVDLPSPAGSFDGKATAAPPPSGPSDPGKIGQAAVIQNAVDQPQVMPSIRSKLGALQRCLSPDFADEGVFLMVRARLASDGTLRGAQVTAESPLPPAVSACIVDVVQAVRIAPPAGGGRVLSFPLMLARSD